MKSNDRGYSIVLIIIEIVGGLAVLLLVGFYYYIDQRLPKVPTEKVSTQMVVASSSILSESNSGTSTSGSAVKSNTVTAYIKSIDANTITLDYFDLLFGEAAEKAIVEDKHCTQEEVDNYRCFNNGVIYFRNRNPKLRTFQISPDVQVFSATTPDGHDTTFDDYNYGTTKILLSELIRKYLNMSYGDGQNFVDIPYAITLDGQNRVIKIQERFRP